MKILIDECVPRKLKAALAGVACATVAENRHLIRATLARVGQHNRAAGDARL